MAAKDPLIARMLLDGPRVLWTLDGPVAQADLTGNGNVSTVSNTSFFDVPQSTLVMPGSTARTPRSNGSGGTLPFWTESAYNAANNAGTGEFCLEIWVRLNNPTNVNYIQLCGRDIGAFRGPLIYVGSAGTVNGYAGSGSVTITSTKVVLDSRPHHIVWQRRAGVMQLWIDAHLEGSVADASDVNQSTTSESVLRAGTVQGIAQFPNGWMSHVAWYTKGLDPAAIRSRYEIGMGLVAPARRARHR